jgi:signal transduction histidine kinase
VARDDRGITDPGVNRDRFLSEFALALVEGVQLQEFLDWSVAQIGRILDVDRLTLFLFGAGGAADALVVRASWAADGVDPIPVTIPLSESVVSARLKQFESVVVEDVEDAPDLEEGREILRRLGTKSLLAVPIGIDSALRGFVAAAAVRERRDWTPDDVAFLESAVHHLSAALKQTELVEELGRERDRLSVLFDLASAVQRSTTVNDVVETALSGLRDTLLFPIGVFSLVTPEGDAVIGLGGYGGTDAGDFSGRIPLTPECPTVSFRVLESGQPLIVNDVEEEPEGPSKERFRQLGARSFGVFPMRSAGKTIGVMSVASRDLSRRIEFDDVETLQSLADFVGVALEQRRAADAVAEAMREARSLRLSELVGTPEDGETIALGNARLIEELQRSNRLKDDFLANLSHEIRTPLTGIVGWAEVLLDSHRDDADARRALEAILGQADTLTRMLADLIDLSRIDNFGLELGRGPVAIPEILAAALDAVSPGARRRGVVIRCTLDPDLPPVEGDAARLKQVLWNLLANGVKFSSSGGTVHVAGRRASGGGLEIAVEDEGHGIDPEFLPLVFDRFRQEETSSNRRFGGLGIGLAIARTIVLAHGGTIVAESEGRERGSRFVVTFPPERVVARREDGRGGKRETAR